ncbi:cytochrome P450 [Nesterenkonia cremea]|uniref:Cytochrome P450 n=1 Tax=Nesterenkonia cremea TaxID=1882340 RepID=A0A917AUS4_9MICC|nr:cytochrome P450 [Nesterenkonia cremea]GGE76148.1 cytochrome P450 [Nesterenkonia cremea]
MTRSIPADFSLQGDDHPDAVHAVYDRLREQCPVAYTEDIGGYWTFTRYEDIREAAGDADTFISSVRAVVPSDPRGIRRPPLNFDAPRHTPFRRALTRTLSARRTQELVGLLSPVAEDLFSEFARGGGGDISRSFGTMLPARAACLWLGLEEERGAWLAQTATEWVDAWRRQDGEEVTRHSERMYEVAWWLLRDRRENPRDPRRDPASSLLTEHGEDGPLADELIVGALRQSLVVGMVAPPILIGSMAAHLAEHPELAEILMAEPDRREAAVEEFIRLFAPYRGFARTVSCPVSLHGRRIEPEEPVTMSYAAANRDPRVFPDPHRFDLDRPNAADHLGFGRGRHQCVGMHLARGIIRLSLDVILDSGFRLHLVEQPRPTRMPELGFQEVHLRLEPISSEDPT